MTLDVTPEEMALIFSALRVAVGNCVTVENDLKRDISWNTVYGDPAQLPEQREMLANAEESTAQHLDLLTKLRTQQPEKL